LPLPETLSKLPIALHAWELAWTPIPDPTILGILVVCEQVGKARFVGPVSHTDGLVGALTRACTAPTDPAATPARPSRLLCTDPELRRALSSAGFQVEQVAATLAADAAQEQMLRSLEAVFEAMMTEEERPKKKGRSRTSSKEGAQSSQKGAQLEWLAGCPHNIQSARWSPRSAPGQTEHVFLLRMARRDAQTVVGRLREVSAIRLVRTPAGPVALHAERAGKPLGVISEIDLDERLTDAHRQRGAVTLAVVGDGLSVPFTDRHQAMLWRRVRVPGGPPVEMDPVFRRPPSTWPKISLTFQRYLEAAFGDALESLPPEAFEKMLLTTSVVWNAQTWLDYSGDATYIDQLHQIMADNPIDIAMLNERLLTLKQTQFRGDPRLVDDPKLVQSGGGWVLRVAARWVAANPPPAGG
jgi:hypothetical protein